MKHTYEITYRFVDMTSLNVSIGNREENISEISDVLTRTQFISHCTGPTSDKVIVINLHNVTSFDICEKKEVTND